MEVSNFIFPAIQRIHFIFVFFRVLFQIEIKSKNLEILSLFPQSIIYLKKNQVL